MYPKLKKSEISFQSQKVLLRATRLQVSVLKRDFNF